jgi:hypothetical protein
MTEKRPVPQIGLRLSPDVFAWLEKQAKEEDRSLPYLIKRILTAEMKRETASKPSASARAQPKR